MVTISDKLCEVISGIQANKVTLSINRKDALYADSGECELIPVFNDPKFNEEVMNFVASLIKDYFVKPINVVLQESGIISHINSLLVNAGAVYDVFRGQVGVAFSAKYAGLIGEYGDLNVAGDDLLYISADDNGNWVEATVWVSDRDVALDFMFNVFSKFVEAAPDLSKGFGEGVSRFIASIRSLVSNREEISRILLFVLFP